MIDDKDLKSTADYSEGQKQAAYSILGEIVNILSPFAEDMRIVGGWVPSLLYQNKDHIGSIDVDVLLNQLSIEKKDGYATIQELLRSNGYTRHSNPKKYFTYVKPVEVDSIIYPVEIDLLSGMYGGKGGSVSKHIDGIKALPATGGNFAFDFPAEDVTIQYRRPDGAEDMGHVKVVAVIPFLVMKTAAMGRGKPKDAYDIYFCLTNYEGGVRALAEAFEPYRETELVKEMRGKLAEKFASPDHAGPTDIVKFLDIQDGEETARVKQDAFQRVKYLVDKL